MDDLISRQAAIDADSIQAHEMSVFGKRLKVIDEAQTVIEAEP